MARSLTAVARMLAAAHRKADKKTVEIKLFPAKHENVIRLLEVSDSAPTTGEVLPFSFGTDVANGVDYPSVVILLSPTEWQQVVNKHLSLPSGWNLDEAVNL